MGQWTDTFVDPLISTNMFRRSAAVRDGPRLPPDPSSGVFMVSGSSTINASRDQVWGVLVDFNAYREWNPFVRAQNVADSERNPLPDSSFAEGLYLDITEVHIPPSLSDDIPFWQKAASFERIVAANKSNYTVAWELNEWYVPDKVLHAERWSIVSDAGNGQSEYLSYEVFTGGLAYVVQATMRKGLEEGFKAQADALKARVETLNTVD